MKKNRKPGVFLNGTLKKCLTMMKWSVFFFFLSVIQVVATDSYAQQTRLTLKFEETRLENVLNVIENQSEFYFLYNQEYVDTEKSVSLDVKAVTIDEILSELFKGSDINYTISDRQIVLTNVSNESGLNNSGQQTSVSGKVSDQSGAPLPGVTVIVKGTTTGAVTGIDGDYIITNIPEESTLVFSFVGMKTQEVVVGANAVINVTLLDDAIGLEEVVAIGYGTVKKRELTGSVSSVKSEDFNVVASSDAMQLIQGKVAGLSITRTKWWRPNCRI